MDLHINTINSERSTLKQQGKQNNANHPWNFNFLTFHHYPQQNLILHLLPTHTHTKINIIYKSKQDKSTK